jgi:probable rRNA maturation factor
MKKNKDILKNEIYGSVSLISDSKMKKLNKKYLDRDQTTDVLSFEINEKQEDGTIYLGDVVVNKEQARIQAKDYENTLEEEISELVAHGVLHLLGVHHEDDDEKTVHGKSVLE